MIFKSTQIVGRKINRMIFPEALDVSVVFDENSTNLIFSAADQFLVILMILNMNKYE